MIRLAPLIALFKTAKAFFDRVSQDRIALVSAGVAFYGLLALFPAITAALAVGGLLIDPTEIVATAESFEGVVPGDALSIVTGQASKVAGTQDLGLSLTAWIGLALAVYSASRGVAGLIQGMNAAARTTETRGFIRVTLTRLGLTLVLIIGVLIGLTATIAVPAALSYVDLGPVLEPLSAITLWFTLLFVIQFGLNLLYRFGPAQPLSDGWRSPGAMAACVLWLMGSAGFAFYVANFGAYGESFGALGGVIVLLTWFWLSAFIVLLGAEINVALAERAPIADAAEQHPPETTPQET